MAAACLMQLPLGLFSRHRASPGGLISFRLISANHKKIHGLGMLASVNRLAYYPMKTRSCQIPPRERLTLPVSAHESCTTSHASSHGERAKILRGCRKIHTSSHASPHGCCIKTLRGLGQLHTPTRFPRGLHNPPRLSHGRYAKALHERP